ncbi:MAG: ATP-dependent RecD-like DNA helicase [Sumerlaeia bacterium]
MKRNQPWNRRPDPAALLRQPLRTETELRGIIERIVYTSDDGTFTVARFVPQGEKSQVTLAGTLLGVAAGEPIHARGSWRMHKQHGPTFEVEGYLPILPDDAEMLKAYLGSGLLKGIGETHAARIVDHFGEDTLRIIEEEPDRLKEVPKIGKKTAATISECWADHKASHETMMVLQRFGLSPALAKRLYRHYGNDAAAILKSNPYRAGIDVSGIGFAIADRMARGLGIAGDAPQRIAAAFFHLLSQASDRGHTYVPREELLSSAVTMLGSVVSAELAENVFESEAAQARHLRVERLPDGVEAVFMTSLYRCESGCARLLIGLMNGGRPLVEPKSIEPRLDAFEAKFSFQLAPQQRQAIHSVLQGGVSVVTGGPGTGKTTLVRALLHVLATEDLKIAMCSPTGRAAQRLSETTRQPASTVHRLLGFDAHQGGFQHNADAPLKADLVIVDESSMLDVALAYHLLKALTPDTALVFVGDVDQLPSVGAGNFLHDVIESARARVTRLNVIFRQARESLIIVNSHRINHGEMPMPGRREKGKPEPDFYVIDRDDPEGIREALMEMVTTRIPQKFGFHPVDDIQVLSPMRRSDLGIKELNDLMQGALNPKGVHFQSGGQILRVGDKIMQTSNNYDLDVFNGDVGRITAIETGSKTLRVQFGKRSVEYRWDEADQLQLAYAVTIHKSQGSEYPAVVVLLHTQHFIMLQRNLLYTAVTRGKKLVVLIGSKKAIRLALRQSSGTEEEADRRSALRHWLVRPPEGDELF